MTATVVPTGESALRVTGATGDRERDWRMVHRLARTLHAGRTPGLITTIPTYESVLVEFDPTSTTHEAMTELVSGLLPTLDVDSPLLDRPRTFRVPVRYGGDCGPDLDIVAAAVGLTPAQVIAAHTAARYTVRCLGAPGGSPMLYCPTALIGVPRLRSPRKSAPQGAVSLAGFQATVTPAPAPGGWCIIGRTPLKVLDLSGESLVPYQPGDTMTFEQIDDVRFAELVGDRLAPEGGPR
jgi:KipI family sensor histidine kinase inhibitor